MLAWLTYKAVFGRAGGEESPIKVRLRVLPEPASDLLLLMPLLSSFVFASKEHLAN